LFIILITVLVVALVIWLVKKHRPELIIKPSVVDAAVQQKSDPGSGLADSLNAPGIRQVRISAGRSIPVTDTIFINKDSLHIVGNGAALVSDSSLQGLHLSFHPIVNISCLTASPSRVSTWEC
jgi:hypothetical protein